MYYYNLMTGRHPKIENLGATNYFHFLQIKLAKYPP